MAILTMAGVGALAAVFTLGALTTPAQAQNYPWCAQYNGDFGGMNCGFVSFEQCLATVHGIGGFCVLNNTFVPPAGPTATRFRAGRP